MDLVETQPIIDHIQKQIIIDPKTFTQDQILSVKILTPSIWEWISELKTQLKIEFSSESDQESDEESSESSSSSSSSRSQWP